MKSKIVYISIALTLMSFLQVHSTNVLQNNNLLNDTWLTPALGAGVCLALC